MKIWTIIHVLGDVVFGIHRVYSKSGYSWKIKIWPNVGSQAPNPVIERFAYFIIEDLILPNMKAWNLVALQELFSRCDID